MKQQQQTGVWLLGGFLIAVVVAALAYFFLISPELDKASTANADAEIARSENEMLETQILGMQAKEKEVPGWQEEIGKISLDLPPTAEQVALEQLIYSTLKEYDLPAVEVTYGRPEVVIPTLTEGYDPPTLSSDEVEPSPSPSPEPSVAPTAAAEGEEGEAAVPPPPVDQGPAFSGLVAMPVTIATEGDPADVLSVMKELQTQIERFYTATNFTITKADITEETPGRVALTEDDWTISLAGMVFSLIDPAYSFPGDVDGEVPAFTPGDSVTNPFAPLPGTEESEKG